jgi:hypothetical protein
MSLLRAIVEIQSQVERLPRALMLFEEFQSGPSRHERFTCTRLYVMVAGRTSLGRGNASAARRSTSAMSEIPNGVSVLLFGILDTVGSATIGPAFHDALQGHTNRER